MPDLIVRLSSGRTSPVFFSPLAEVPDLMEACGLVRGKCLVVTDRRVGPLYGAALASGLSSRGWMPHVLSLPAGEHTKSAQHLGAIYDFALSTGIDRRTPLLALGGGVIGDVVGFAAATLLRGLPLVQLPTSLIAQVDSAIGGKTGINHSEGKNLIGAFHQPQLVCADLSTLRSLPDLEWSSGLAEVVKHALIADTGLLESLERHWPALMERQATVVRDTVIRAAAVKVAVVNEDEREASCRMTLNFGHTFGHAIEREAGYGRFTHGEAVALGMRAALKVSHLLEPMLPLSRLMRLVSRLPVRHSLDSVDPAALHRAMYRDKKVRSGTLRLVLLRAPGEAYVTDRVTPEEIDTGWAAVCSPVKPTR
ncbi:MAG: 3-dehydroquinate synthase [Bacteroidota bacterium]|nr:3-dehydroquinate synthase [Bacteroidota bacterium]